MPYLFAVSINGADRPSNEIMQKEYVWDHFIKPLGDGDFDTFNYLKTFMDQGFEGPVGLQCYGINQDKKIHLQQSLNVWQSYLKKLRKY